MSLTFHNKRRREAAKKAEKQAKNVAAENDTQVKKTAKNKASK